VVSHPPGYVEPVPDSAFDAAAVKGIVTNLDPHSAFSTPEYTRCAPTTGSYTGVGREVRPGGWWW
jgi:hypothetical protein